MQWKLRAATSSFPKIFVAALEDLARHRGWAFSRPLGFCCRDSASSLTARPTASECKRWSDRNLWGENFATSYSRVQLQHELCDCECPTTFAWIRQLAQRKLDLATWQQLRSPSWQLSRWENSAWATRAAALSKCLPCKAWIDSLQWRHLA